MLVSRSSRENFLGKQDRRPQSQHPAPPCDGHGLPFQAVSIRPSPSGVLSPHGKVRGIVPMPRAGQVQAAVTGRHDYRRCRALTTHGAGYAGSRHHPGLRHPAPRPPPLRLLPE